MKKSIFLFVLPLLALSFFQCKSDDDTGDCVCIEIFAPVCGEDGKVYDNSCFAECAGVEYTDGYCPEVRDGIVLNLGDPVVDGCGWVIQFDLEDEAINFRPDTLADAFLVNGLNVRVNYTLQMELEGCGKIGQIQVIKINSIETR
jgi:hypothetical protein